MTKENKRGRPSDPAIQQQRKEQLMDTAYQLLNQKSYRAITIREIAEQAGMKSAMISYYFTNKEGLFTALIERYAATNSTQFEAILKSPEPIKAFIKKAVIHFSENPALSRLIADEVLTQQSDLGDKFLTIIPKKIATFLPMLIRAEQKAGRIHADLNPKWAAFSLMSMIVMPFIAAPAREKAWGISLQDITSDAWTDQLYHLYMSGCKTPHPATH
ncbi:TetR/AcrR family transcriptional regulator [Alkalimarinus alittae]|uniref:TetR family transcriptional regulator n=1 Tax=Alkalimarinus alittae TaxID=2961619 RepID=A0ABY6N306_9ALTE|nr:TetR/AcrR family transcriptional regulator [Alkalimarinus alittae]UZE96379.1 TetR family transcriptional regulator [Alkalimarinus alittae]